MGQQPAMLLCVLVLALSPAVHGIPQLGTLLSALTNGTSFSTTPSVPYDADFTSLNETDIGDSDWQMIAKNKVEAKQLNKKYKFALLGARGNGKGNNVAARWWKDFKTKQGKQYRDAATEDNAKKNFLDNLEWMAKHNDDDTTNYWVGPNEYSEYSMDTLKNKMFMQSPVKRMVSRSIQYKDDSNTSNSSSRKLRWVAGYPWLACGRDWKVRDKITPVKNQGLCGSCWAFAASSAIESAYMISLSLQVSTLLNVIPISLSEQQLLDCENPDYGGYSQGCSGGYSDAAIDYVFRNKQTTDTRYGYRGIRNACNTTAFMSAPSGQAIQLGGTESVFYPKQNDTLALMQAVDRQPVVTYVEVSQAFTAYSGGVFNPTPAQCGTNVNHAVVIVGYWWSGDFWGSYWIIQNSWGTSWGDKGFMKVQMQPPGPGACGMYMYPIAPSLSFSIKL